MNLKGATAIVTGGSQGLGFSIVKALVAKGARVHIISRSKDSLENARTEIDSPLVQTHVGDVTDFAGIEKIVAEIGRVDILINNAGVWLEGELQDTPMEQIKRAVEINLMGVIATTKAVLPGMLQQNNGYVLNVSSTSGLVGRSGQAIYVASKFGVTGFTKSLQEDLVKTNVKVAGFYPGGMSTQLFTHAGTPKENADWMDTDKVAEVIVFMLERDDTMVMDHVVLNKRMVK